MDNTMDSFVIVFTHAYVLKCNNVINHEEEV